MLTAARAHSASETPPPTPPHITGHFTLATLDIGVPPAWQVLAFGLAFALAAAGREAFRLKAARQMEARRVEVRQIG